MKWIFTKLESAFVIFSVISLFGAFLPAERFLHADSSSDPDNDPINFFVNFAILLFIIINSILLRKEMLTAISKMMLPMATLFICFASASWSGDPMLTIKRSVVLSESFLMAAYLSVRYPLLKTMQLITMAMFLMAISCWVTILFFPVFGTEQEGIQEGIARGVFSQKNVLAQVMWAGCVLALYLIFTRNYQDRVKRVFYCTVFLLTFSLVIASHSSGIAAISLLGVGVASVAGLQSWNSRYRGAVTFIIIAIGTLMLAVVIVRFDLVLDALGRDASLTGRDTLWKLVGDYIAARPMEGYGFGAFWREDGPEANLIWDFTKWKPYGAHNAWLEILLNVGAVGAVTMITWLIVMTYRAIYQTVALKDGDSVLIISFLVCIIARGYVEANLLRQGDFTISLLLFFYIIVARRQEIVIASRRERIFIGLNKILPRSTRESATSNPSLNSSRYSP